MKLFNFLTNTNAIPINMVLGADVSHWQGWIDWLLMKGKGIKWAITKATDFWRDRPKGFIDVKSVENHQGIRDSGMLSGGYCWLQPRIDPKLQARFYLDNFYNKYETDFPPILDFEDTNVYSWSDMLWRAEVWLDIVEKETGKIPIIYTSKWYIDYFNKKKAGFLSRYPLWASHYIQRTYPTIPAIWNSWKMWQYTDKGDYPYYDYWDKTRHGRGWGVSSGYLDLNWYNGTYVDLLDFCESGQTPIPPYPIDEPESLFKSQCIVNILNVRSGVGTIYPVVDYLNIGDIVDVYEVQSGWFKIGEGKWVSGNSRYMRYLDNVEAPEILFQAKCMVNALNKRLGAGTNYLKIEPTLKLGDVVDVYEVKNNWYRIKAIESIWVSGYSRYMQKI